MLIISMPYLTFVFFSEYNVFLFCVKLSCHFFSGFVVEVDYPGIEEYLEVLLVYRLVPGKIMNLLMALHIL